MADKITKEHRSWNMSRVRGKDTEIEIRVRSAIHRMGFRFRKNVRSLPGIPDIVMKKHRTAIFVNGCFWHQHSGCVKAHLPKSNIEFWKAKLRKTVKRDAQNHELLRAVGWKVIDIWECEVRSPEHLNELLRRVLVR